MKGIALVTLALVAVATLSVATKDKTPVVSDQDVVEAYQYMLGRWVVLRQETADLKKEFRWNEIVYRAPGEASWANPHPNEVRSEAWIYVDASSCTILKLPEMRGHYYTVQVLNGWGEVTAEISKYRYPQLASGSFALCLQRTQIPLAAGIQRVGLPNKKSRMLMRIELGARAREALALQKQVTLRTTGSPDIEPIAAQFEFANAKPPGVEAFDKTEAVLVSEADISKSAATVQDKVRAVAKAAADPKQREHIDAVIREQAIPNFLAQIPKMGPMINGWVYPRSIGRYGNDYLMRSIADFTGLWASNGKEAIYFGNGELDGSQTYVQTFSRDARPIKNARYGWSIAVVDGERFRVVGDSQHGRILDKQSLLKYNADGSLTLAFAPQRPANVPESNWLSTPAGQKYTMTYRVASSVANTAGEYYPPALMMR
jgi:hypothetical protein